MNHEQKYNFDELFHQVNTSTQQFKMDSRLSYHLKVLSINNMFTKLKADNEIIK